jgi:CRISPR-associated protein Cmr1
LIPSDVEVALHFRDAPCGPPVGSPLGALSLKLEVRLVTVLCGGGTQTGRPDDITEFRSTSVRGHLRFWWRATRGAQFRSWEELRRREGRVWGETDYQSPVRVRVDVPPELRPTRVALSEYQNDLDRKYALFPLYQRGAELDEKLLLRGGGFHLKVSVDVTRSEKDAILPDVEAALWAWLNLGGLGARTRRGAGALYCKDQAGWSPKHIAGDGDAKPWPTLKGSILLWGPEMSWDQAWTELLRLYREFRQDRDGRGPTHWPEPDEIRSLHETGQPKGQGFPRSTLGLPIVFHFKDRGEPPDYVLTERTREQKEGRMTSPIIIRPFAVAFERARPVVLILNAPEPSDLYLFRSKKPKFSVTAGTRDAIKELISRVQNRWHTAPVRL